MTPDQIAHLADIELGVQVSLLVGDIRDGFANGMRMRGREIECLTGVASADVIAMAKDVSDIIGGLAL